MRRKVVLRSKALRQLTKQTVGCLRIPELLKTSITDYLSVFPKHRIKQHVAELAMMVKGRRAIAAREEKEAEALVPAWEPSLQVQEAVESYLSRKSLKPLPERAQFLSQRKLKYEEKHTVAFVAARMPASYSVVHRVLSEIARRIPDFKPTSVLDYGTGPGTTIWALREIWPGVVEHVNTIETSPSMIFARQKLFEDVEDVPVMHNHRSLTALNRTRRCGHDLVVASYAIGELKSVKDQITVARQLWSLTSDILVLIEPGNSEGSLTIRGIRAHILALEKKKLWRRRKLLEGAVQEPPEGQEDRLVEAFKLPKSDSAGAHVVAPCPHDGVCPMDGTKQWCHFVQRLERTLTQRVVKKHSRAMLRGYEDEKFCYVVLRRGQRPGLSWPLDDLELRMDKEVPPTGYFVTDDDEDDEFGDEADDDREFNREELVDAEKSDESSGRENREEFVDANRSDESSGREIREEFVDAEKGDGSSHHRQPAELNEDGPAAEQGARSFDNTVAGDDGTGGNQAEAMQEDGEEVGSEEEEDEDDNEEGDQDDNEEDDQEYSSEEDFNYYGNEPKPKPTEEDEEEVEESTETVANLSGGWGRVIFRPYRRGRHVILDVCRSTERDGSAGSFDRVIVTKSKHRVLHREAKKARWGDLWPCRCELTRGGGHVEGGEPKAGGLSTHCSSRDAALEKQWLGKQLKQSNLRGVE